MSKKRKSIEERIENDDATRLRLICRRCGFYRTDGCQCDDTEDRMLEGEDRRYEN